MPGGPDKCCTNGFPGTDSLACGSPARLSDRGRWYETATGLAVDPCALLNRCADDAIYGLMEILNECDDRTFIRMRTQVAGRRHQNVLRRLQECSPFFRLQYLISRSHVG
jgi:hypothetical protein